MKIIIILIVVVPLSRSFEKSEDWDITMSIGVLYMNIQGGPKVVTQTFGLIAQRFVPH